MVVLDQMARVSRLVGLNPTSSALASKFHDGPPTESVDPFSCRGLRVCRPKIRVSPRGGARFQ